MNLKPKRKFNQEDKNTQQERVFKKRKEEPEILIQELEKQFYKKEKQKEEIWEKIERKQKEYAEQQDKILERIRKEQLEELERLERLRIQRLGNKSEFEYCIDRLIQLSAINENQEKIQVSAYNLGFSATIGGTIECHNFLNKLKEYGCFENVERLSDNKTLAIFKPNIEKLKEYRDQFTGKITEEVKIVSKKTIPKEKIPNIFRLEVKDRYIFINNYLLSKPHAVGSNFEFFEHIRSKPPHTKIERKNLPDQFGGLSLKEQVKNKSFIKILNELGFKGEILKAFFPKRSKDMVVYRGDKITKKDLEKAGVNIQLFLKELELAHLKNNPE